MNLQKTSPDANTIASTKLELPFDANPTQVAFYAKRSHKICVSISIHTHILSPLQCLIDTEKDLKLINVNLIQSERNNSDGHANIPKLCIAAKEPMRLNGITLFQVRIRWSTIQSLVLNLPQTLNWYTAGPVFHKPLHLRNLPQRTQRRLIPLAASSHSRLIAKMLIPNTFHHYSPLLYRPEWPAINCSAYYSTSGVNGRKKMIPLDISHLL